MFMAKKMKRPEFKDAPAPAAAGGDDEYGSLFGEADSGGDAGGDDSDAADEGDDESGESGDADGHTELTPHELAHTSLADATYEQLCAAAEMKKPRDEGAEDGDEGGDDDRDESDPSDVV